MASMPHRDPEPWYTGQVYARYWKHYSQAMQWLYRHKRAYRIAVASQCYPPWYAAETFQSNRYADWEGGEPSHPGLYSRSQHQAVQPPRARPCIKVPPAQERESEMEDEEDSDSEEEGIECDMSNMEITEELRQYFAQTERHREELKPGGWGYRCSPVSSFGVDGPSKYHSTRGFAWTLGTVFP
ncbi:hypothetical protein FKM82_008863, partial [Ascaphus truei]